LFTIFFSILLQKCQISFFHINVTPTFATWQDAKLNEIDTILKEEITPTLAKLKDERSSYLEYQKIIRELEHLNKLYVAYQFVCGEEVRRDSADEQIANQELMTKLKKCQTENADKIKVRFD